MKPEQEALLALGRALLSVDYRFVTVTPATHQRVNARARHANEGQTRSLRDVFGWNRTFGPADLPANLLELLRAARALETLEGGRLRARVRFSTLENLILVHSAFPTTEADAVFFGPDTYRFSKLLALWVPHARCLVDVGCGTGAGGLVAADRAERIVLCDINPQALAFAEVNAALAERVVSLVESDVLQAVQGDVDVIITNPPYMRDASARTYRDGGGAYGEALSVRIVRESLERLKPGGCLIVYTGSAIVDGIDQFFRAIAPHLAGRGYVVTYEELDPDVFGDELDQSTYAGVERIAAVGLKVELSCPSETVW